MYKFWADPQPNSLAWAESARGEGAPPPAFPAQSKLPVRWFSSVAAAVYLASRARSATSEA